MNTPVPCYKPSVWTHLLQGTLPEPEERAVLVHLESCLACQQAIQEAAADSAFGRQAVEHLSREPEPNRVLQRALAEISGQDMGGVDRARRDGDGSTRRAVRFGSPWPVDQGVAGRGEAPKHPASRLRKPLLVALATLAACLLVVLGVVGSQFGPSLWRTLRAPQGGESNSGSGGIGGDGSGSDTGPLAQQAQAKLATYCYRCHGKDGMVEGGFNYLMDRDQLVASKKIVPGEPQKSRLFRRIVDGQMPPEDEQPRPSADDVAVLRRWIEEGAPAFAPPETPRSFITLPEVVENIDADLEKRNERDRPFTRYFTLTHLYDAGLSEDEIQTYRNGLVKLLNSLSWSRQIVSPVPIDQAKTVLRIDLRDFGWTGREWETLLADYPYGMSGGTAAEEHSRKVTGCEVPYLRGDWFVATASRPPLYHELLRLPDTEKDLERLLHIDVDGDIRSDRVARAGFNGSGVSRNNRLIERHETSYGAYWKSYDFAGSDGAQNLFERPLGPGPDARSFQQSGGEIIFNLPNGLQAYMLVNGRGDRIDKGPTAIVSDPKRPDRAVENGLSCMSCHSGGINAKADQIRAHVKENRGSFPDQREVDTIYALYPPPEKFNSLIRQDAERFQKAAADTGARVGATEPVMALATQFEASLDLSRAAAELGLERREFVTRLDRSRELGRTVGSLKTEGGTVQRQTFEGAFPDLVRECDLGTAVRAGGREGARFELGGTSALPPYMAGSDAGESVKDGFQLKNDSFIHTKDSDFYGHDFVFELTFEVNPDEPIMLVGIGDGFPFQRAMNMRIHRPDLANGGVNFSRFKVAELSIGRLLKFGTHVLRMEKKGNSMTITIHADSKGKLTEVAKHVIVDLKELVPYLTGDNAVIYAGHGGKIKAVRLTKGR